MEITDRSKDVIKSGGEWISSIELENAAIGCAGRGGSGGHRHCASQMERAAAAGGGEESRAPITREDVLAHLTDKVAKWWLPDDVVFVDEIPHTATGKISKLALRERFMDYRFPFFFFFFLTLPRLTPVRL